MTKIIILKYLQLEHIIEHLASNLERLRQMSGAHLRFTSHQK